MNKPKKIPATAYILIGGESKRFGSLKWQTTINGQTILDRIWDACDGIENRYVIGKENPNSISYPFIKDELEINAPINGLYTALKYSKTDWILLLSCDLPLIGSKVFNKLWDSKSENCDIVIPVSNDKIQVACGFYQKRIFTKLESEIQNGNYSLFKLVEKLNSYYINFGDNQSFLNMNTKKDLRTVKKILISKASL
ncbi:MAG: molybdenum cofactor guanylyltransferase [Fidelibacterota bacterium]